MIAIIVGGSSYGYRRGLFKMAAGPIMTLLCLVLSLSLCDTVGDAVVSPLIGTPIRSYLLDFFEERSAQLTDGAIARIPTILKVSGAVFGVSYENGDTVQSIVDACTMPLISLVSRGIAFVFLFIAFKLLLKLIVHLADSFLGMGIIGRLNRIMGAMLSVLIAILCAFTFTLAVDYLFRLDFFRDSRLVSEFDGGPIYRFFVNFNLINLLLSF